MKNALNDTTFVCFDCETTGLDFNNDRIIEIAVATFSNGRIIETFESLVDPKIPIPQESQKIHNISNEMVQGQPSIDQILPNILKLIGNYPIVGHGVNFDIKILASEALRHQTLCDLVDSTVIDTLRLARYYGQAPVNSLQALRRHFNIPEEIAHRAMGDVVVNIQVFKHLSQKFRSLKELIKELENPIELKTMPLGKHKGRSFKEIPIEYLRWALNKDFDIDLKFSIKQELKRRKKGNTFNQAANPFKNL